MKSGVAPKKRTLIFLALAMVLIAAAVVIIERHKSSPSSMTAKFQSIFSKGDQEHLKSGDLTSYQNSELTYATGYMAEHNYKAAAAALGNIKKNVPEKQWDFDTYLALAQLAKAQGKSADYKNYMNNLISKFNDSGDTQSAQFYKKQLQGN